jgi:hypothetical protein
MAITVAAARLLTCAADKIESGCPAISPAVCQTDCFCSTPLQARSRSVG